MRLGVLPLAISLTFVACGSSAPTAPGLPAASTTAPTQAPPAGAPSTAVCLLDAVASSPLPGVTVTVNSRAMAASDAGGDAVVWAEQPGQYAVTLAGSPVVTRTTSLRIPASETNLLLIPAAFDMAAFDEMFRPSERLQRWTSAPPLVILTRAVQYEGNYANDPVVLGDEMSDADREQLARDLSGGFVALTDHQLGDFASVNLESPMPGSRVNVMRTGAILVARCKGLTAGSTYWGYGRWATGASGAVVGGNVMLDADFDGPSSPYPQYRRCLRVHELGHALGYNHVTVRQSVMNSSARLEPNAWDLQAVHIAFLRPPGNTAPDNDPVSFSVNVRTGAVTWSPPIF